MQVIDHLANIKDAGEGTAVALGNFDGVHLGHRDIFRTLVRRARELGVRSLVYTFDPHPLKVLAPERAPLLLNTAEEKVRLIAASNIDILACIPFSVALASCEAEDFVRDVLVGQLHIRALVIGYDFAFGRDRRGTGDFLRAQGEIYGFSVDVLQPVGMDGQPYSSSRVRELLAEGRVEAIPSLLGRHYTLAGKVVGGEKRGRTLGFPTANISTEKEQLPAAGVYAVIVRHKNTDYQGLVNIGCRPTYGPGATTIEVYLLDFSGDIYADELRLYFVARLREEKIFADSDALIAAIRQDVALGRELLKDAKIIQYQEYLSEDNTCAR
ncbi:bifunctional riboflavin kinase/FAD synthetase [Geopsychrobacter electrodiphilus]|uniref:bifunctional riboflavin kinase/FAD synthetase n=1 Tax=Geopsychrobacter electrodiphilus TaxID=225196 RepID=UPI000378F922|nr:bifunctional riboflavin kinase/FAD synthetase [Geopsychrobacter electrodiphilus]